MLTSTYRLGEAEILKLCETLQAGVMQYVGFAACGDFPQETRAHYQRRANESQALLARLMLAGAIEIHRTLPPVDRSVAVPCALSASLAPCVRY
jgi:hypothetical protein